MSKIDLAEILELSVSERLELAEDIWDSIAADPAALPLPEAQRAELERRLAALAKAPTAGASWDDVKRRLQGGSSSS